jgi:hypothetical protein
MDLWNKLEHNESELFKNKEMKKIIKEIGKDKKQIINHINNKIKNVHKKSNLRHGTQGIFF